MNERGFTLVEMMAVIAVMAILTVMATMQFGHWVKKTGIERQAQELYADLQATRAQALYTKRNLYVKVTPTTFAVYSTVGATGVPLRQKVLQYPVTVEQTSGVCSFDNRGLTCDDQGSLVTGWEQTICINPSGNEANVDSILLNSSGVLLGKWNGSCNSASFQAK